MALYDQTFLYTAKHNQNKTCENCPNSRKHNTPFVKLLIMCQMYHNKNIDKDNNNNYLKTFLNNSD